MDKEQQREYHARWYRENKDRIRERRKAYYAANPDKRKPPTEEQLVRKRDREKQLRVTDPERMRAPSRKQYGNAHGRAVVLCAGARLRAKRRGLAYDLTVEWVEAKIVAGVCEATGRAFELVADNRAWPWAPSLDQVNPKGGYTMDNTKVVVWAYNMAKGPWSEAEFAELCDLLADLRGRR